LNQDEIMAVVVSFNGGQKTLRTIDALIGQVDHVHVVDNSSAPESVSILEKITCKTNVSVSWLPENKGIGHALNIGIRMAHKRGYRWLLTMDQDSIAHAAMIQAFINLVDKNSSMVCLAPQYSEYSLNATEDVRLVDYAITSGNLVRMDVFDRAGLYNEELFIDGVDFDFSLRVRSAGLNIYLVGAARMQHELGDKACTVPVLGRFHTFHTPLRRYYIYRNYLYLVNRYATEFPGFAVKITLSRIVYVFTILLFGEQRLKSMLYISHGFLDYFRDIDGPFQR